MNAQDLEQLDSNIKQFPTQHVRNWFAISRDLFEHPVVGVHNFDGPWPPTLLWVWMVGAAAFKEQTVNCEGQAVLVRRGQLAMSLRFLGRRSGWSVKAVRTFLRRLEKFGMITMATVAPRASSQLKLDLGNMNVVQRGTVRGTGKGTGRTVITICNYDKYQTPYTSRGTGGGTVRGTAGAQRITIKQEEKRGLGVRGGVDKSAGRSDPSAPLPAPSPEQKEQKARTDQLVKDLVGALRVNPKASRR